MAASVPDLDRFSLQLTVWFNPSDLPKFWSAFKPIFDVVAAEPQLLYFEVFEDPAEPGKISWIENWDMPPQKFLTVRTPMTFQLVREGKLTLGTGIHAEQDGALQAVYGSHGTAVR